MLITTHCLRQVQLCPFGKTAVTQQQRFWHSVSYAQLETVNAHDQALVEWQNTWPSDLRLDEFGIAYAMSRNASEDMVRRGVQCMYLYGLSSCWSLQSSLLTGIRSLSGLFNLTRLRLNRPTAITTSKEAATAHDRMAGAAAKLIAMYAHATPDYMNSTVLTIPGHLGHAPYNLFTASVSSTTSVSLFGGAHMMHMK